MRTAALKRLVEMVLDGLPKPLTEDVIDDVFYAIETTPAWRQEYDDQCRELTQFTVNQWCGIWVASALGKSGLQSVASVKNSLTTTYSKLTAAIKPPGSKLKEDAASNLMWDYYQQHKEALGGRSQAYREEILDMLMDGVSPERAFSLVPH